MASTPLLGLSLPADGTTNWGTLVNTSITALIDSAVAGTTTVSSTTNPYILSTTAEATNEARQAVILCTGARTEVQTIIAPNRSKTYVVINATTNNFGVKIVGTGPTTGVTVPNGKVFMVAWNGSDFVAIGGGVVNLATDVTGVLGIGNGGTGQSTQQTAINALVGTQTANRVLRSDGTNSTLAQVALATDVSGTLPVANGGTGQTTYTDGQLLIGNSTGNTLTKATLTASTGVSVTNGSGAITITNTAPDQVVSLTGAGATTISGTYPNFTISSVNTTYGTATTTVNGLIKLGDGTVQTTAANAVSADASRTYAIQLNASGQAVVNVPWTSSSGTATNIAAGAANQILYQSGASTTTFITAPTVASTYLSWNGSAFTWTNITPGSTFATDITVNTLTVGKGPSNPTGTTTFGYQAGAAALSTAIQQTAIGYRALASNTTTAGVGFEWEGNTAVGYKALEAVTGAGILSSNTAVGAGALLSVTTGAMNTALGSGTATGVTNGIGLTAIGALAGNLATNGGFIAVGYGALRYATGQIFGSVAVGQEALFGATTFSGNPAVYNRQNTAVGHNALYSLSAENTGVGGSNNTVLGYYAGRLLESGSNNTIIGNNAQASTTTISNEITLGNSSVTTLRCQVTSITSLSDQRDKHSIEDLPVGLNLINALRPRRYKWDKRDWYVDEVETIGENGQTTIETVSVPQDGSRAQNDWNEGFVAQEAKAALQSLGADWFPLVYESNPEKLEMSSGKLIPVLVKAIQELTARLEALEAK
jgi:hypothetical protein